MRPRPGGQPINILLVEDNEGDVRLTIEALREGKISNRLSVARDGVEALAFVRREGRFATAPRPDLILLDLELPLKDGREVLAEIKADHQLSAIPVVILTLSRTEQDMLRASQLDVKAHLTKPIDLQQFIGVVQAVDEFSLTISVFPHEFQPTV
jgi:CheY-like chemotaxis protein